MTFYFTTRRPPTSTLFPYTTLFRSWSFDRYRRTVSGGSGSLSSCGWLAEIPARETKIHWSFSPVKRTPLREDRKSTRLNSSHVSISYAVFCLKKKINGRQANFSFDR